MEINTATNLYGVIGNPIAHSMSPAMHNAAFREIGHNGVYLAFDVTDLKGMMAGIRALNIKGLSVTIPHKVTIIPLLDEVDALAEKIGAVNTIVHRDNKLYGTNTDCLGAVRALEEIGSLEQKRVLMIGAGGAARAIGFGVQYKGADLTILNIIKEEGETLAAELGVPYHPLEAFGEMDYDILVHATPVGMHPDTEKTPVPIDALKPDRIVMDIIYNPLETKLLAAAEDIGCRTIDGAAMFVYQGAAQFELWTGKEAPVVLMRDIVLKQLNQ